MDVVLRQQVLRGHARLIFNVRDGVLVVLSLDREIRGHHLEGDVASHVQPGMSPRPRCGRLPITSNLSPVSRTNAPTDRRPGNNVFSSSLPRTITLRFRPSSISMSPPP